MIPQKSAKEIEIMREGGGKLAWVMEQVLAKIKPEFSLAEIDSLAEKLINKQGGQPSFKMVRGYHWTTCLNINQGVVHGIPTDYRLKKGDFLSVDMGMFYRGWHTDMARTVCLGGGDSKFLQAGQKALRAATKAALPGNRIGHLSQAIEKEIVAAGFQPIKALVGHGVGKKLHEPPQIPCYLKDEVGRTKELKQGMALAIEVIYARGDSEVRITDDGWTVETVDGSLAGLFENTVAITEKEPLVLTQCPT